MLFRSPDPWLAPYCYPTTACPLLIIAFIGVCRGVGHPRSFRRLVSLSFRSGRCPLLISSLVWLLWLCARWLCPGGVGGSCLPPLPPGACKLFGRFFRRTYGFLLRDTTGFLSCWLMRLSLRFALRPAAGLRPWTYIVPSCVPRIHGFVLLVPGPPPLWEWSAVRYGWVAYGFWTWFASGGLVFSWSVGVFLLLFRGVFLWVARLRRLLVRCIQAGFS